MTGVKTHSAPTSQFHPTHAQRRGTCYKARRVESSRLSVKRMRRLRPITSAASWLRRC